ncbi:MAG: hypothetical protein IJE29_05625 [Firmicutes bacterium]|nr:hypothetical protein [Bacillota bacterium]MBQ3199575.1 hypothetical protein [Bacillota bacterium]
MSVLGNNAAAVGVIGGADGPTSVFVTGFLGGSFPMMLFVVGGVVLVSVIGLVAWLVCRNRD